jgi:hypothetical protein
MRKHRYAAARHTVALAGQAKHPTMIEYFLSAIGGAAVALAAAWYLSKEFISLQIKKALQKSQFELDQKSAALKAELSIYAHEQSVGLTRLDAQRSEAIKEIHELMMHWHEVYMEIFKPVENNYKTPIQRRQQYYTWSRGLVEVADAFSKVVTKNAIYFEQSSYEKLARFGQQATNLSCDIYDETFGKVNVSAEADTQRLLELIDAVRAAKKDLPPDLIESRAMLVSEFRKLMSAEKVRDERR